jgi:formate-dependent nitrite reductase membrane component NrfD
LYSWTKGIASGVYLVAALLVLFGFIPPHVRLWLWVTPIISGVFLGITGLLLIWDLEHPERFYMIFTRPQWRSWLVKGAFIIAGYSLVLALHFIASLAGSESLQVWLLIPGIPLSIMTAVYTAYLFGQAKARDMWQSPLLPPHLLAQALMLGGLVLCLATVLGFGYFADAMFWVYAIALVVHLLCVIGEITFTHPTTHARLAVHEMVRGRYRSVFWTGMSMMLFAAFMLVLLALVNTESIATNRDVVLYFQWASFPIAALGLLFYEHAYVQAGQSVPLA